MATKVFPNALRIANRFHVNRYITDALQDVRIRLSKDKSLSPDTRKLIKGSKKIIGKHFDQLTEEQYDKLLGGYDSGIREGLFLEGGVDRLVRFIG